MSKTRGKTEGGSGGKRGHSNMEHWDKTAWVKRNARKARRAFDRREVSFSLPDKETPRS